ncbi:efflux transporter periplasmic adaptor subunit, partial [Leptospira meyeri]
MLITLKSLNQKAKILLISGVALVVIAVLVMIFSKPAKPVHKHPEKAEVFDGGLRIEFKPNSPGLEIVKSTTIGGGGEFVSLEAPA